MEVQGREEKNEMRVKKDEEPSAPDDAKRRISLSLSISFSLFLSLSLSSILYALVSGLPEAWFWSEVKRELVARKQRQSLSLVFLSSEQQWGQETKDKRRAIYFGPLFQPPRYIYMKLENLVARALSLWRDGCSAAHHKLL